jgi:hypothetical protein
MTLTRREIVLMLVVACVTGAWIYTLQWATPARFGGPFSANPGDVGVTNPQVVLSYHDRQTAPAYCRNREQLLDQLRQTVLEAGRVADASSCTAATATDPLGTALSITCKLTADANGCSDTYSARLWVERDSRSLVDYKLRAFGWIQRTCVGDDAVFEAQSKSMSRGTSATIERVLAPCREAQ